MKSRIFRSLAVAFSCAALSRAVEPVDFNRDIQPILSENCYQCHGPDAKAREADLRLDRKESAYRTVEGVTPIKPGDIANSDAIIRIFSTDKTERMPPPKSHRTLTEAQRQLLKRWVEEGAKWGEHWAFVAPKRPKVPGIADIESRIADWEKRDTARGAELRKEQARLEKWAQNPIDAFVLDRLLREGLAPSPEAAPETLCRRLSLDLTGLPPTLDEVDAFVAGTRGSYEALTDHLLASPRYGERMVWEWLDAARYADTNGYQGDPTRAMWYWRDWAIKALNDNMPFDRFTVEQLAGDLLPNPSREQLVATGFHRNHMINGEGGRIAEESRVDYVQDRVETTGTVWLGLTLTCCRCHDHKFDPITQKEYYQLSAYFNSIEETGGGGNDGQGLANPTIAMPTPEQQKKLDELKSAEEGVRKESSEIENRLRAGQPQWEESLLRDQPLDQPADIKWTQLVPDELFSDKGSVLAKTEDGAVFAKGPGPERDEYVVNIDAKIGQITAFKLEALPDPAFKEGGPGRAPDHGNFVLSELTLQGSGRPVDLGVVSADFEQGGTYTAKGAFDGDPKTGWAVYPKTGEAHTLIFEARNQVGNGAEVLLSFRMSFQYGEQHTLGKFKLYATTNNRALLRPMPKNIRAILVKPGAERAQAEKDELTKYYFDTSPQLANLRKKQEEAKKAREAAQNAIPRTMVMREREKPRDTFVLVKGAYDKYADKVAYGIPAVLPSMPADAPQNRLALARWLVSPAHPLTARVVVNRYWQLFFGRGLVKTTEDFGIQGDKPTHPELLDWLAREFIESGWDVKHLHRLIVSSATYRQASRVAPGMAERDPDNKLLARGPRHRLPSWMLRDQALAVSSLLVEKVGGPPVKVYQPANIWEEATFGQIKYSQDHGEALYRRSLYIFWRRIIAPPLFFDVANRQQCAVKTGLTNTPLHALVTLNDITYVEAARAFAERMMKQGGATDEARLTFGFRLCTARAPGDAETQILASSLARFRQQYAADGEATKKLIATGESKPDSALPATELAAHTALALLLLNLDETLTNE
jgi:hypothetical protein